MKKKTLIAAAALAALALPVAAQHWSYEGEAAPANWSKLDPKFVMCGIGRNQSPIDLGGFVEADLKPLAMKYSANATEILNNGHTVQVNHAPGSMLTVDGKSFELKQFHFHAPSENTINGKQFPLEMHLVHGDKEGNLAVVSVMFSEGAENAALGKFWQKLPGKKGDKNPLAAGLGVAQLLPKQTDYYAYSGSLTTPPCSEGVRWIVVKSPASVSKAQVEQFSKAVGVANNRPVQGLNARAVLQ
jgi:carbonic anhydrase